MKGEREINASTEKDESSGSLCRCRSKKKKKNRISLRIEARIGAESDFFVSFDHQKFPILLIPFPSSFALARDMANAVYERTLFEKTTIGKGKKGGDTFPFYLLPYRSKSRLEKKNDGDEARGSEEGLGETKGLTRCFET